MAIAERSKAALGHLRRKGKRDGAPRFGFDLGDDDHWLMPYAAQQATIGLMKERRGSGQSY